MRTSKIIRTLKLLSHKELKEFGHFVDSSFCNKKEKCKALYKLLLPYAPAFSNDKLDDPDFTKSVYKKQSSMNTLFNDLIKLLEKYMIELQLRKRGGLQKYLLLEELRERRADRHFNLVYTRSLRKIKNENESVRSYHDEYLLERSNLDMLFDNRSVDNETLAINLEKSIRAFDKYMLSNHLLLDNTVFNIIGAGNSKKVKDIFGSTIDNSEIFSKMANQNYYKNEIVIELQLLLRQLHRNENEKIFLKFYQILKKKYKFIEKSDYSNFCKDMVNYCILRIVEGNSQYYKQLVRVYSFAMETEAFIEGKYLEANRMKNIIIAYVRSGEIELAKKTLDRYIGQVNPAYQSVVASYCKGYLYFHLGEYNLATDYLQTCMNLRSLYALDAERIQYKIYYETNQGWAFEVYVKSFITRLSREKDKYPKGHIEGSINFFRILKRIYRKKTDPIYNKNIENIKDEIKSIKYILDKKWLLEKLDELND